MAEGLLNYTRLDDPDDVVCTTQGRPMSPDDEVRARRRDRPATCPTASRARCSPAAPTPCAATTGPPSTTPAPSPPTAGTAPATSSAAPGGQPRRRGPGQGHDQPRRREDLRRGGREPRLPAARRRPGGRRGHARPRARRAGLRLRRAPARRPRSRSTRSAASWTPAASPGSSCPSAWSWSTSCPSTKVGKIDKKALRADIADRLAAERAGAPA